MNASGGIWLAALSSVKTYAARSKSQPFSSKHLQNKRPLCTLTVLQKRNDKINYFEDHVSFIPDCSEKDTTICCLIIGSTAGGIIGIIVWLSLVGTVEGNVG